MQVHASAVRHHLSATSPRVRWIGVEAVSIQGLQPALANRGPVVIGCERTVSAKSTAWRRKIQLAAGPIVSADRKRGWWSERKHGSPRGADRGYVRQRVNTDRAWLRGARRQHVCGVPRNGPRKGWRWGGEGQHRALHRRPVICKRCRVAALREACHAAPHDWRMVLGGACQPSGRCAAGSPQQCKEPVWLLDLVMSFCAGDGVQFTAWMPGRRTLHVHTKEHIMPFLLSCHVLLCSNSAAGQDCSATGGLQT